MANDLPTNLELLSEALGSLERMSRGKFNTPPWDNCNKNQAKYELDSMVETITTIAKDNGIKLNIEL